MTHTAPGVPSGLDDHPQVPADAEPPTVVLERAQGRPVHCVWQNGIGGQTWQLDQDGVPSEYLKVGPAHPEFDPSSEAARLGWAAQWARVPRVVEHGTTTGPGGQPLVWLSTVALPGRTAIAHDFDVPDSQIIHELGSALRRWHDSAPVEQCPWTWSVQERASRLAPDAALHRLPAPDLDLVVAHGDACNPNFLFANDGGFVGYVDLGRLGVADRWADLAAAVLSLGWNFGPDLGGALLDGYGIEPDPAKLGYYTALWQGEADAFAAAAPC